MHKRHIVWCIFVGKLVKRPNKFKLRMRVSIGSIKHACHYSFWMIARCIRYNCLRCESFCWFMHTVILRICNIFTRGISDLFRKYTYKKSPYRKCNTGSFKRTCHITEAGRLLLFGFALFFGCSFSCRFDFFAKNFAPLCASFIINLHPCGLVAMVLDVSQHSS